MRKLFFTLIGLLSGLGAMAQTVTEVLAPVPAGQPVVLLLRQASLIRVRPATDGQLRVKATVNINQNKLNDAFSLRLVPQAQGVRVESDLSGPRLAAARPGDCPPGSKPYYGTWDGLKSDSSDTRAKVCVTIDFDVTLPPNTPLRVATVNGNIEVRGLTGPLIAESVGGFVDADWGPAQAASVALSTISGVAYTDYPLGGTNGPTASLGGYQVRGTLGKGPGPKVRLESVGGDVFLRRAK